MYELDSIRNVYIDYDKLYLSKKKCEPFKETVKECKPTSLTITIYAVAVPPDVPRSPSRPHTYT